MKHYAYILNIIYIALNKDIVLYGRVRNIWYNFSRELTFVEANNRFALKVSVRIIKIERLGYYGF